MANAYSQVITSFVRTGSFPLEADYVFNSEQALKDFYAIPENKAILHTGLLKIVLDATGQSLWWVTTENGELQFTKLLDNTTIDSISDLADKLELEILDRKTEDEKLWGTGNPAEIQEDLNSIKDLADAVTLLRDDLKAEIDRAIEAETSLKEDIKAVVGTEEDDVISYLSTLDYGNLTKLSNELNRFLNTVNEADDAIETFPELLNFLQGYKDTDVLKDILDNLVNDIMGDPLPTLEFRTLRGIEDFVRILKAESENADSNLQTELDLTLVGVGLSSDGSYSADKETNYLQNATSVMNALKILDLKVNEALRGIQITADNDDIVPLEVVKYDNGYTIGAKLLLSNNNGNLLEKKQDGLYYKVKSYYKDGTLTLKVNDNIVALHNLGLSAVVESAEYDPSNEVIKITFKLLNGDKQIVDIPVTALIREWGPDNSDPNKVVELTREEVIADGSDKLSADVRISTNSHNILTKDGNTLLVEGISENIAHKDTTVSAALEEVAAKDLEQDNLLTEIQENMANIFDTVATEVARASKAEKDLEVLVTKEATRSIAEDTAIKAHLEALAKDVLVSKDKAKETIAQLHLEHDAVNAELAKKAGIEEVNNLLKDKAPIYSPIFLGVPQVKIDPADNDSSLRIPSTAWVRRQILDSVDIIILEPNFENPPEIANPPAENDNSNKVPTTGWVLNIINKSITEVKLLYSELKTTVTNLSNLVTNLASDLTKHLLDFNNPHKVTAELINVYTKEEVSKVIIEQVENATKDESGNTVMELLKLKADLVDGVIPEDLLPFNNNWNEV